ncbi:hypothetical protein BKA65DRAFT_518715 [Rhexocercosporidium sp. MPI-PUGE-AT-0058]|nr:hypothetical protein BKA65DRAFT_518715 [Rhexocercosporidium sp. MPI-PUGE-AT-0058]
MRAGPKPYSTCTSRMTMLDHVNQVFLCHLLAPTTATVASAIPSNHSSNYHHYHLSSWLDFPLLSLNFWLAVYFYSNI